MVREWFACCALRDDSDVSEKPTKPRDNAESHADWYPRLLGQLQTLAFAAIMDTKMKPVFSSHHWAPRIETERGVSLAGAQLGECRPVRKNIRRGDAQARLREACASLCMAEAWRELQILSALGQTPLVGSAEAERVRRVGERAQKHLDWWASAGRANGSIGSGWPIVGRSDELNMDWGFKLEGGLVHATFSTVITNGDLARLVAGLSELTLYAGFNDDFVRASCLENNGCPNDTVWQLLTHNAMFDVKSDNIWQVSVTDALEEPEGVVIVDLNVPTQEGLSELRGIALPGKQEGFSRSIFGQSTYFISPIENDGEFRLVNVSVTRPAPKLACLLSTLPKFAQARILRAGAERSVGRLKHHITRLDNEELDRAMKNSVRAPMYARLREHLVAELISREENPEPILRFYSFDE